jgi:UrcA family protein
MDRFSKVAVLTVGFGLLDGLLGGGSALAADGTIAIDTVSVAYADLDLSTDAGAQALFARIKSAAALACGGRPDGRDPAGNERFQACRKDAMSSAVTRIGNPRVAALYDQAIEQTASAK